MTKIVTINGVGFSTASEAIQHMNASGFGDSVISLRGDCRDYFLVTKVEAERLERERAVSAFWFDRDGVLMSVPT